MKNLISFSYTDLLTKTDSTAPDSVKLSALKIGDLVNLILPYVFFGAGIALLIVIILGGIELMTSGGDPKKVQAAQGKITSGLIGFLIIFVAYWIVQLVYKILGVEPTYKII